MYSKDHSKYDDVEYTKPETLDYQDLMSTKSQGKESTRNTKHQAGRILDATLDTLARENEALLEENYILRNHLLAVKENAALRVANVIGELLKWLNIECKGKEVSQEFQENIKKTLAQTTTRSGGISQNEHSASLGSPIGASTPIKTNQSRSVSLQRRQYTNTQPDGLSNDGRHSNIGSPFDASTPININQNKSPGLTPQQLNLSDTVNQSRDEKQNIDNSYFIPIQDNSKAQSPSMKYASKENSTDFSAQDPRQHKNDMSQRAGNEYEAQRGHSLVSEPIEQNQYMNQADYSVDEFNDTYAARMTPFGKENQTRQSKQMPRENQTIRANSRNARTADHSSNAYSPDETSSITVKSPGYNDTVQGNNGTVQGNIASSYASQEADYSNIQPTAQQEASSNSFDARQNSSMSSGFILMNNDNTVNDQNAPSNKFSGPPPYGATKKGAMNSQNMEITKQNSTNITENDRRPIPYYDESYKVQSESYTNRDLQDTSNRSRQGIRDFNLHTPVAMQNQIPVIIGKPPTPTSNNNNSDLRPTNQTNLNTRYGSRSNSGKDSPYHKQPLMNESPEKGRSTIQGRHLRVDDTYEEINMLSPTPLEQQTHGHVWQNSVLSTQSAQPPQRISPKMDGHGGLEDSNSVNESFRLPQSHRTKPSVREKSPSHIGSKRDADPGDETKCDLEQGNRMNSRSVSPYRDITTTQEILKKESMLQGRHKEDIETYKEINMFTSTHSEQQANGHIGINSELSEQRVQSSGRNIPISSMGNKDGKHENLILPNKGFRPPHKNQTVSPQLDKRKSRSPTKDKHSSHKSDKYPRIVLKPSTRLIGEIAFELDRMILQYVFWTDKADQSKRLYGYMVKNIPAKIVQESFDPITREVDEEKRYMLEYRYQYVLNSLKPFGYDLEYHPDYCIDLVNKYGLLPLPADRERGIGIMPEQKDLIKETIARLAPAEELKDICILIDCLALLARDSGKALIAV